MKTNPFEHGRWANPLVTLTEVATWKDPQITNLLRARAKVQAQIARIDAKIAITIRKAITR